jgi:hypothetical protein
MNITQDQIQEIASLPSNAYKFKAHIDGLIDVYRFCRDQWTRIAIQELTHINNLDLRKKEDRAKFGWHAAQELAKALPPVKESHNDTGTVKVLAQAIALLPPVPETNGLENAPVYRIFGSPVYLDELRNGYKALAIKWHPDNNSNPEAEARFKMLTETYSDLTRSWFEKYSPLIAKAAIGEGNIKRAMSVKLQFTPESFWV